jgi:hypothetical protein
MSATRCEDVAEGIADPAQFGIELCHEPGGRFETFGATFRLHFGADRRQAAGADAGAGTLERVGGPLHGVGVASADDPQEFPDPSVVWVRYSSTISPRTAPSPSSRLPSKNREGHPSAH